MKLGGYEIRIPEGTPHTVSGNPAYVVMQHGQVYTIRLSNSTGWRVDCDLSIDGEHIGRYRVDANASICLVHPADQSHGQFTFFAQGSREQKALGAQLHTEQSDLGLITARFIPEADCQIYAPTPSTFFGPGVKCASIRERELLLSSSPASKCPSGHVSRSSDYASGQTGLTGNRKQHFVGAEPMVLDYDASVTIYLRLISANSPRPIVSKPKCGHYPPALD